jgi:membrane-bound lytic murein transglycosylase A
LSIPNAALEPVGWGDLDGWTSDDHAVAFATFNASCRAIVRAVAFRAESATNHAADPQPVRTALEHVCIRAIKAGGLESEAARRFFETNFVPVRIRRLGDSAGFVTGYYDPIVDGSRMPTREFTVPLYRRPRDLVAPGVAEGGPFPNTGRAFRRSPTGKLVPYYDRGEIEAWGTRRSTSGNLLAAHRRRCAVDRDGGFRTCPPRGRLDASHQL